MSMLIRTSSEDPERAGERRWQVAGAEGATALVTQHGFLDAVYHHSRTRVAGAVYARYCKAVDGECWGDVAGTKLSRAVYDTLTQHGEEALYVELELAYVAEFGGVA